MEETRLFIFLLYFFAVKFKRNEALYFTMSDDLNKATWKPKFLSEYSMGELDFNRFNDHLKFVEQYCGEINSTDIPTLQQCQNYFSGLNTLYKLWRPLVAIPSVTEAMDNTLVETRRIKRMWENAERCGMSFNQVTKIKLADTLDGFHTKLMNFKQIIGLGIVVKRNFSTKEKIRQGMGRNKTNSNYLPEP
jgi:hypothetical protein